VTRTWRFWNERLLGYLPEDPRVVDADRRGESAYALAPPLREAAARIADALTASMSTPGE
jgi:hypothetical protein